MKYVFQQHGETYLIPDQLNGSESDDDLIIPEKGIRFILSLQIQGAINKQQPNKENLTQLLKEADGAPGPGFFNHILKEDRIAFLNEISNTAQKDPDTGLILNPPSLEASPADYYHFFKKMVNLRNGLWSTKPEIVNLVGLRRVITPDRSADAGYNDTIACCWLDEEGNAHCELNIATTEPGNRIMARQLFPQTMTMVAGYHNMRQPAGRTRNALKEGSAARIHSNQRNDRIPEWCAGDTTMNFHQGGNGPAYPCPPGLSQYQSRIARNTWLSNYGLDVNMQIGQADQKADTETLFRLNLVLSEIFLILSKYGEDGSLAPYENLKKMTGHPPISRSAIINGKITLTQNGYQDKVIDVNYAKERTVRIWFDKRRNEEMKKRIYEILYHISDYSPEQIKSWKTLSLPEVIAVIKDEHIERIIDIQTEFLSEMHQGVDGIAGNDFYSMITGIRQKIKEATVDKTRIDFLFKAFENLPLAESIVNEFQKSFHLNTFRNRTIIRDNTKHIPAKNLAVVDNVEVGGYSAGCQVFYDTEVFYTFWAKLLKRAEKSGQRRWYYTLIDATDFEKSEVI